MDPVRLRELADLAWEYYSHEPKTICALSKSAKLLTCPDPLTLERAIEVIGRPPDETNKRIKAAKYYWRGDGIEVSLKVWESDGSRDVVINGSGYLNINVGVFACLVLAAKQGVGS